MCCAVPLVGTMAPPTDRDFRNEIRELRAELKELKESVKFMNAEFEEMKKKLVVASADRDALRRENTSLRETCKSNEILVDQLQKRTTQIDQYSRRCNLEVKGLVQRENEDVTDLVVKIGHAVGETIMPEEIETCHRVPTRDHGKSNVVVQFKTRQKRDSVLEKARKKRIRNREEGVADESPIFVNEHLCPALKRLLSLAINKKRERHWRFVWTRNGKIFARRSETSDAIRIECERDLGKID